MNNSILASDTDVRMPDCAGATPLFFIFRRLHSLVGLYALGLFVCQELYTVSRVFLSANIASVNEALSAHAPGLEFLFVYLPLVFYFLYEMGIWLGGHSNLLAHPGFENFLYDLERVTGLLACVFVGSLLWFIHLDPWINGQVLDYLTLANWFSVLPLWPLATLGFLATLLHLTCLFRRSLFQWGLVPGAAARNRLFFVSLVPGLMAFLLFGLGTTKFVYHFVPAPRWLDSLVNGISQLFFN